MSEKYISRQIDKHWLKERGYFSAIIGFAFFIILGCVVIGDQIVRKTWTLESMIFGPLLILGGLIPTILYLRKGILYIKAVKYGEPVIMNYAIKSYHNNFHGRTSKSHFYVFNYQDYWDELHSNQPNKIKKLYPYENSSIPGYLYKGHLYPDFIGAKEMKNEEFYKTMGIK